jgi:hypothetical protein
MLGKSSRKRGKSCDNQTVHKEQQLEKAEAENISDDKSSQCSEFTAVNKIMTESVKFRRLPKLELRRKR